NGPLLDEAGLGLALRNCVEGYVERSGVAVEIEIADDVERLAPDTEFVLFRVVQEALTNISRHSNSPTARIHLMRTTTPAGHEIVLTVEDSGRGMPDVLGVRHLLRP